jgi:hypothetical protein
LLAVVLVAAGGGGVAPRWTVPPAPTITDESVIPVSVGAGPEYVPAAHAPRTACVPGPVQGRYRAHVELFANRRAIVIPAGIGLRRAGTNELGRITRAVCRARVRTLDPTGVVDFDAEDLTLADLFETWGVPYADARMLSFGGPVEVYVNGARAGSDPRLTDRVQIVVEVNGYVPPHRSFRFPRRG